jgi:tRNA (cytidine/uridine-2'-O-)-methyltransferase
LPLLGWADWERKLAFPKMWPMSEAIKYQAALHVVLYQPEIPHNTGSVGRTCVATGAKLWLVEPLGFRLDDYYLRRAGLDYWPSLEWEVVPDWAALTARLPGGRFWFFSKSGVHDYHSVGYQPGDVLVFGNESQGLPESLRQAAGSNLLRIPIRPQVRSLNLSNAVAIVLYEGLRQGVALPASDNPSG